MSNPSGGATYDFSGVDKLNEQEEFTSFPQQALGAVEGVARGASLNASDYLEAKTGLTSLEDIEKRRQYNPGTSLVSSMVGAAVPIVATSGLFAPIEAGVIGAGEARLTRLAAAKAARFAAEAGSYAAGTNLVDTTLGDKPVNGQKIATDIGLNALFGAGLGFLSKGIEARFGSKAVQAAEDAGVNSETVPEAIAQDSENIPLGPNDSFRISPEETFGIEPKSLEEMERMTKEASYMGIKPDLPTGDAIRAAMQDAPMSFPITEAQLEALTNAEKRTSYGVARQSDGKNGEIIRNWEAIQKAETTQKTDNLIQSLAPGVAPEGNAIKNGERAIEMFTNQYQAERKELAPIFEALKNADINAGENVTDHLPGVIKSWTDAVPNLAKAFDTAGDEIKMLPYKTSMGIERSTYNAVKDAVDSIESRASQTMEELWNIRRGLDQHINPLEPTQAGSDIRRLKAAMMDYMEGHLQANNYDLNIRDAFKRYAINEQERQVIEKTFGASVGTPEFGAISKIKPENVIDNIFKNTATVNAAKVILPKEQFNELLMHHLAEQKAKFTQDGIFSSRKFGTFLKKNQDVLNTAFSDNPRTLRQINAYNTIARLLPDAVPQNPSHTAPTLMKMLKATSLPELAGNMKKYLQDAVGDKMIARELNKDLAQKAIESDKANVLQKMIQKVDKKIENGVKSIFGDTSKGAISSSIFRLSDEDYKKQTKAINNFAFNQDHLLNHVSTNTKELYSIAPNNTQHLNDTLIRSVQFLSSKIPSPKVQMPFSKPYEPSDAQKYKFETYYRAVDNPVSVLSDVKEGVLTNESMEALSFVHPDLLQEMRKKIIENYSPEKVEYLDYPTKLSLSKFLGQPLDEHMLPQAVASYQQSMMPVPQSPQMLSQRKPTLGGLKELKKDSRTSTRTNMQNEA